MTFKPAIWHPIAMVLSAINLAGAGLAAGQGEPIHSATHVVVAMGFAFWALRLRSSPVSKELEDRLDALEAVQSEVQRLGQEVSEMQERLDFAERVLAQRNEPPRVNPER